MAESDQPVMVNEDVVRKVSQENRVAVYRTIGLVLAAAVVAVVIGILFTNTFSNTNRLDRAICIEIRFLDAPESGPRARKLAQDLKKVSRDCPSASVKP